jgi:hypothetical protein
MVLSSIPASAQDATGLTYGEEAPGKLRAGGSVAYEFKGDKGDLVVVQVVPGADGGLLGSEIKIVDEKGKTLADSSKLIIFGRTGTIVGAELSKAGTYTITVFSSSKSDEGDFTILLVQAEAMEQGKPIEDTVESTPDGERSRYKKMYAIRPDQDTQLTYSRTDGEYAPAVVVYAMASGNNLFPAMYTGGSNLTSAALAITNQEGVYFVAVGDLGFASFGSSDKDTKQATFKLALETPQSVKSSN